MVISHSKTTVFFKWVVGSIILSFMLMIGWSSPAFAQKQEHSAQAFYITTTPTAVQDGLGRLNVFAIGADARVYSNFQNCAGCGWSGWFALGSMTFAPPVIAMQNADGRLEIFARGSGNGTEDTLYHNWEVCVGCAWAGWASLTGEPVQSDPALIQNSDGSLEAFYISQGEVHHIRQTCAGCGWANWESFGNETFIASGITATKNSDGRVEIFVGATPQLVHKWQLCAGCDTWSSWHPFNGIATSSIGLAAGQNSDGRLEVFATQSSGDVDHIWQQSPGGIWSDWEPLDETLGQIDSDFPIAVASNQDGRLEVFALGGPRIKHKYQTGQGWSTWQYLGSHPSSGGPVVAQNQDGRLEVFIIDPDRSVWHAWQTCPNCGWSDWSPLT